MKFIEMYCQKLPSFLMKNTIYSIILLVILSGFTVSCSTPDLKPKLKQAQAPPQRSAVSEKHISGHQARQSDENSQTARHIHQARKEPGNSDTADIKNTLTETEKSRHIEHKFDASLGQFDDMLLKKKPPVMTPQSTATAPSAEESRGKRSDGGSNNKQANNDGSNTHISGSGRNMTGVVNEVRQLSDDDIVARQIREAAENALDPQMKKKLWAEYDKYKSGN